VIAYNDRNPATSGATRFGSACALGLELVAGHLGEKL
jgi:hypothetical protein